MWSIVYLTASARSITPSGFLSRSGSLELVGPGARWHWRPIWKENQVRWHSSPKEQQVWIPPSLGFPGPRDREKGSLTLHSGRPLLRMGSDEEASREKDISLCEWHSISGIYLSWWEQGAPTGQNPFPFLYEGVSWTKGSADIENEVIECPECFPTLFFRNDVPSWRRCQLQNLPAVSQNGVPIGQWRWPFPAGNVT